MSKNLTQYGEQELSLIVANTEYLYRAFGRCDDEQDLRVLCCEFTYSEEQFAELVLDLIEDLKERGEELPQWAWAN